MEVERVCGWVLERAEADFVEDLGLVGGRVVGEDDAGGGAVGHGDGDGEGAALGVGEEVGVVDGGLAEGGAEEIADRRGDGWLGGVVPVGFDAERAKHLRGTVFEGELDAIGRCRGQ